MEVLFIFVPQAQMTKTQFFYVFRSKGMNVDVKSLSTYENGMKKPIIIIYNNNYN